MNNNDILIRTRYALDLKDNQVQEVFKLGKLDLSIDRVKDLLTKIEIEDVEYASNYCDNKTLDAFLNGLVIFIRGERVLKPGEKTPVIPTIKAEKDKNNLVLKKLKTALSLKSEDVLDILKSAGVLISSSELSAVLRKENDRHYKECGDRYLRNFLKGLALRYRISK